MKYKQKKSRGAKVSTNISLPREYHWKVLGAMTEDLKGYLGLDDISVIKDIIRQRDFQRYLSLDSRWGLQCMTQSDISDLQKLKARYAVSSLLKKYLPSPDPTLDALAKEKFLDSERQCHFFNETLGEIFGKGETPYTRKLLAYMRGFLQQLLGDVVPVKDIVKEAKHGPGANLDTQNGDVTSFAKYTNFPYSCTPGCVGYACYMIKSDKRWFQALTNFYTHAKSICYDEINWTEFWDYFILSASGNRIAFVPKTAKISRSIAIEPALNIMLQLGTDKIIRRRLKRFGIDLDSQEPNQRLSRIGSKFQIYATIDLSGASDSISLKLCEMVLPTDWYQFLCKLRSPSGDLGDGENIVYSKISSMGNGYTFVLESAIFAAVVFAAYKMRSQPLYFGQNAAVFGDDIIVRSDMYDDVKHCLEVCGFQLNTDKSFNSGPVRESCGTDWFEGLNIRPVFLKQPPSDQQELFVDHNVIKRYLEMSFGITHSKTCETILKWLHQEQLIFGPYSDEVFDSWLHSDTIGVLQQDGFHFLRLLKTVKKRRFSKAYSYGYWYFLKLGHNLRGEEARPTYLKERVKLEKGSRFAVNSRGFTVKRKPVVCLKWCTTYTTLLPQLC